MKTEQQLASSKASISTVKVTNLHLTTFDQQDGKLVSGIIIEITNTAFDLRCTDGQVRKFDISALPKDWMNTKFCC